MRSPVAAAQVIALAVLLGAISPCVARAASPAPPANPAAAALNDRCRARADIDACYDALRRTPSDPSLLGALGDALARANRPADALRTYRRVAVLSPSDRSNAEKISALEAKASAKPAPARAANQKRFSNAAPESQSH